MKSTRTTKIPLGCFIAFGGASTTRLIGTTPLATSRCPIGTKMMFQTENLLGLLRLDGVTPRFPERDTRNYGRGMGERQRSSRIPKSGYVDEKKWRQPPNLSETGKAIGVVVNR